MVTWSPAGWIVLCPYLHMFREAVGCEYEIKLPSRRAWALPIRVERGNIVATSRKFIRPGIGTAAGTCLWADEGKPQRSHPAEHSCMAGSPIRAAVLSVSIQAVQVASDENTMPLLPDKSRQVRYGPMNRSICIDPAAFAVP